MREPIAFLGCEVVFADFSQNTSRATRPTSNSFEEATCSERGASMAFVSGDCRKRRLSVLVTSAMPSGAARLAETNHFPRSVRCRLKPMKKPNMVVLHL